MEAGAGQRRAQGSGAAQRQCSAAAALVAPSLSACTRRRPLQRRGAAAHKPSGRERGVWGLAGCGVGRQALAAVHVLACACRGGRWSIRLACRACAVLMLLRRPHAAPRRARAGEEGGSSKGLSGDGQQGRQQHSPETRPGPDLGAGAPVASQPRREAAAASSSQATAQRLLRTLQNYRAPA